MPNISPAYIKIAENTINLLHLKCNKGVYAERLFKTVARGSNAYYPLEKIKWMKLHINPYLANVELLEEN